MLHIPILVGVLLYTHLDAVKAVVASRRWPWIAVGILGTTVWGAGILVERRRHATRMSLLNGNTLTARGRRACGDIAAYINRVKEPKEGTDLSRHEVMVLRTVLPVIAPTRLIELPGWIFSGNAGSSDSVLNEREHAVVASILNEALKSAEAAAE